MAFEKATPRPWHCVDHPAGGPERWSWTVQGPQNEPIAQVYAGSHPDNARLTVHTVNHYDELVALVGRVALIHDEKDSAIGRDARALLKKINGA